MNAKIQDVRPGQLFVWADYLHQMTRTEDAHGSPVANRIAEYDYEEWRFHRPRPQTWDSQTVVQVVTIK